MREDRILKLAWDTLFLPVGIFFAGYLKLCWAVPLLAALAAAWFSVRRGIGKNSDRIPAGSLVCIGTAVLLWCLLSGQGGFLPQKSDFLWRNPLFHDLIFREWPLEYASAEQQGVVSYYFLHWMVPAVIGKACRLFGDGAALAAGNLALFLWTALLLAETFLLLLIRFRKRDWKSALLILTVFILSGGMDWLGYVLFKGRFWGAHIEYWTHFQWQYSSPATLLGWVFNQAVPAWLILALYLREEGRPENRALLAVMMLAYAPMPALGFLIFPAAGCVRDLVQRRSGCLKSLFSVQNLISALLISPVFFLFYAVARTAGGKPGKFFYPSVTEPEELKMYGWFILLEFGIMALLLWKENRRDLFFLLSAAELLLFPLGRLFFNTPDFCMRSSVPALFFLAVFLMKACFMGEQLSPFRRGALLFCFLLGCAVPLAEWYDTLSRIPGHSMDPRKIYRSLEHQKLVADRMVYPEGEKSLFFRCLARKKRHP